MKKYQLFNEYCQKEIYGNTLADALLHAGPLPTQGSYDKEKKEYVPGPKLHIAKIIGTEDVSNSRRGTTEFERIIIEDTEGMRKSIDAELKKEIADKMEKA